MIKFIITLASLIAVGVVTNEYLPTGGGSRSEAVPGMLLINEIMASGGQEVNDLGLVSDWIELHNPGSTDMHLSLGKWFISDKGLERPDRSILPEMTIPAGGHVIIWCDGLDVVGDEVHAGFSLSAKGEHLVIYYRDQEKEVIIDDVLFGPQSSGISEGRAPDGSGWIRQCIPSPGKTNVVCNDKANEMN